MPKPNRSMAPYFVQMRELERRLLRSALTQAAETAETRNQIRVAAAMLGVKPGYLRVRARVLGGVLDDKPLEPPPATATEVWAEEDNKAAPDA